jgi:hypothetical protein
MLLAMRPMWLLAEGVVASAVAGFILGGLRNSADPELVLGGGFAFLAIGLACLIVGGVAMGMQSGSPGRSSS